MVLDSFKAHLTEKVMDALIILVIVIFDGCTSVIQPLDVSLNKPVKRDAQDSMGASYD